MTDLNLSAPPTLPEIEEPPSAWQNLMRIILRSRVLTFALVVFSTIVILAILAPLIAPYAADDQDFSRKLLAPSSAHWFGTDENGRDIFSRVLLGAKTSLLVGVLVVSIAVIIGVPIGLAAGYFGGRLDAILMRVSEVFLAFPPLLLPIAITAALGPGLTNAMIALAISWFPWYARIARASAITVSNELYVRAGKVSGASHARLLFHHVAPNSLTPIIVQGSMDFGYAILAAASLSFIGMGVRPPSVEWGLMLSDSRAIFFEYWWTATFPGLAMFLTVLSANLLGDGLRDALDPNFSSKRV